MLEVGAPADHRARRDMKSELARVGHEVGLPKESRSLGVEDQLLLFAGARVGDGRAGATSLVTDGSDKLDARQARGDFVEGSPEPR